MSEFRSRKGGKTEAAPPFSEGKGKISRNFLKSEGRIIGKTPDSGKMGVKVFPFGASLFRKGGRGYLLPPPAGDQIVRSICR